MSESTLPTNEFYILKEKSYVNGFDRYFSLAGMEFICGIFGEAFGKAGINPSEVAVRLGTESRQGEISFSWPSPLSKLFPRVCVSQDGHLKYQFKGRKYAWSGETEWDTLLLADPKVIDKIADMLKSSTKKMKSKYIKKDGKG